MKIKHVYIVATITLFFFSCVKENTVEYINYNTIYAVVNIDGIIISKFPDPFNIETVRFFPDTQHLLFSLSDGGFAVTDFSGNIVKKFLQNRTIYNFELSSDGNNIVFEANGIGSKRDVYLINPDGSSLRNITNSGAVAEFDPNFSPDGTKIIFSTNAGGPDNAPTITIYNIADSSIVQIVDSDIKSPNDFDLIPFWHPRLSKNNEKVYFILQKKIQQQGNVLNNDLYVADNDGTNFTLLDSSGTELTVMRRSVDGNKIIYESNRPDENHLMILNHPTGQITDLGTLYFDSRIDISPDGNHVIFSKDGYNASATNNPDDDNVFIMNSDGSERRILIPGKGAVFAPNSQHIFISYAEEAK